MHGVVGGGVVGGSTPPVPGLLLLQPSDQLFAWKPLLRVQSFSSLPIGFPSAALTIWCLLDLDPLFPSVAQPIGGVASTQLLNSEGGHFLYASHTISFLLVNWSS